MEAPPLKTPRTCSQCGNNGHNARTCTEPGGVAAASATGFMLFGVRLTAAAAENSPSPSFLSAFRKSVSMNNLSQYEQQPRDFTGNAADVGATGYASDDAIHASSGSRSRERKRGVPWTEDEHKLFLMGLKRVGKGDWRGISRNFVKTRTPTQVASHAQKYFLRRSNINRRRRRSSLFDITTDTVTSSSIEEQQSLNQDSSVSQSKPPTTPTKQNWGLMNTNNYPKPFNTKIPIPPSSKMANLNLNQSPSPSSSSTSIDASRDRDILSLKLSSAPSDEESVSRVSSFGGFNGNGDSIISVA